MDIAASGRPETNAEPQEPATELAFWKKPVDHWREHPLFGQASGVNIWTPYQPVVAFYLGPWATEHIIRPIFILNQVEALGVCGFGVRIELSHSQ